jgi:hypothetical protein
LGTTNMQTYIYYNTSLPEGTYEATVKGNLVNLVIDGVRYGFQLDKYVNSIDTLKCIVQVKRAK